MRKRIKGMTLNISMWYGEVGENGKMKGIIITGISGISLAKRGKVKQRGVLKVLNSAGNLHFLEDWSDEISWIKAWSTKVKRNTVIIMYFW